MLEGQLVNLRVMEQADIPLMVEWINSPEVGGEFEPLEQVSYHEIVKWYETLSPDEKWFIIEKKDGTKIGTIMHTPVGRHFAIGYRMLLGERNKGYCTEAVKIIVDFLFLSRDIVRIQAETNPLNTASQKVLEKAGFKREGAMRSSVYLRGKWHDGVLYSILREDWQAPKVLKAP